MMCVVFVIFDTRASKDTLQKLNHGILIILEFYADIHTWTFKMNLIDRAAPDSATTVNKHT